MLSCKSLRHRMVNSSLPVPGRFHQSSPGSHSCKSGTTWAPQEAQEMSTAGYGGWWHSWTLSLPYQVPSLAGKSRWENNFKITLPRNAPPAQHNLTKPGKECNTLWHKINIHDLSMKPLTSVGSGIYSSPLENCWIFILVPKMQRPMMSQSTSDKGDSIVLLPDYFK